MKTKQETKVVFKYDDTELPMYFDTVGEECEIFEVPKDGWIEVKTTGKLMVTVRTPELYDIPEGQAGAFARPYLGEDASVLDLTFKSRQKCQNPDLWSYYFESTAA